MATTYAHRKTTAEVDPWSYFDYKPSFTSKPPAGGPGWAAADWRRLQAYKFCEDLYHNRARFWLQDREVQDERREYGDAGALVETVLSSLRGRRQSIVPKPGQKGFDDQLQALRDWWDDTDFNLQQEECERDAVKLGDGVYVLDWVDDDVRCSVYHPKNFFPVPSQHPGETFPRKVHVAYEYYENNERGEPVHWLRVMTWWMGEVDILRDVEGQAVVDSDGNLSYVAEGIDATKEDTNKILRTYPWGKTTTDTCFYSDFRYELKGFKGDLYWVNQASRTQVVARKVDLKIDFIPVVQIVNTKTKFNYGESYYALVAQLLDDLQSLDTDLQASATTTGSPPIIVTGSSIPKNDKGKVDPYAPRGLIEVGDGDAHIMDTSKSLDALLKGIDAHRARLSVNGMVPESLMGVVKPSEVPSGITLSLSFSPHTTLVHRMRGARKPKYRLFWKFILKMKMMFGDLAPGAIGVFDVQFGNFLPADKKETVDLIVQLLQTSPPAISLETAIQMLMEAGFSIEDAKAEIKLILSRWYEGAEQALSATGDINVGRGMLGLPLTTVTPPPDPNQPPPDEQ